MIIMVMRMIINTGLLAGSNISAGSVLSVTRSSGKQPDATAPSRPPSSH